MLLPIRILGRPMTGVVLDSRADAENKSNKGERAGEHEVGFADKCEAVHRRDSEPAKYWRSKDERAAADACRGE